MRKSTLSWLLAAAFIPISTSIAHSKDLEGHRRIIRELESVGIEFVQDSKKVCKEGVAGMYDSVARQVHVCVKQDWGEYDLDTLRHEAHHVVQDCIGGVGDGVLDELFNQDQYDLIKSVLGDKKMMEIIMDYDRMGASEHTIRLELEAFAVAAGIEANSIADKVKEVCATPQRGTVTSPF